MLLNRLSPSRRKAFEKLLEIHGGRRMEVMQRLIEAGIDGWITQQRIFPSSTKPVVGGGMVGPEPVWMMDLRNALGGVGLEVFELRDGRPKRVMVCRASGANSVKILDDADQALLEVGAKPQWASLHVAQSRHGGGAMFNVSGFDSDKAPEIYLFFLASEGRTWVLTARELRHIAKVIASGKKPKPRHFFPGQQSGSLRLSLPKKLTGMDLEQKVLRG